ncbi:tripartite motif-containing protein 3-like [Paramacrobiotus metropolitanus]|uniref:tripartite motif-containing protein 3-like n=1 Tax=Paramacrobiotus metropolitanus TaxID=2943436 RepID=UPI00244637B3|nr:tripartite motif-containing protein 3-like [Paramacrobiotus metropolitanus]XP_055340246.1 tripartite motif-containing protein 3-like [Paramacrobiotus metropolitanus]
METATDHNSISDVEMDLNDLIKAPLPLCQEHNEPCVYYDCGGMTANTLICTKCRTHGKCSGDIKTITEIVQDTKNAILGLLQTAKSQLNQDDGPVLTSPDYFLPPSQKALSRSLNTDTGSRTVSQRQKHITIHAAECRRNRLRSLCSEINKQLEENSIASILTIRSKLIPELYRMFHEFSHPVAKVEKMAAPNRTFFRRSASNRLTSGTAANSFGSNERKGFICAITNGMSKDGLINALPGKEVKLRMFLWNRDVRGQPLQADNLTVTLSAPKESPEDSVHHEVKRKQLRSDSFEITFTLHKEGWYNLHVQLSGHPVSNSPFYVSVKSPVIHEEAVRESLFSACSALTARMNGRSPSQKSTGSDGRRNSKLSELDEDSLATGSVGSFGREPGHFLNPQGVCVTDEGIIAVTDSNIGCIQLFGPNGEHLKRFGDRGRRPGQIFRPTGIAFVPARLSKSTSPCFVVADYENRSVLVYGTDGQFLSSFGSAKLTGPKGIAVALNGDILVVDNRSNSVLVFRNEKLFKKIWSPSSTAAHLAGPHYITVSAECGDIFISDFHHHTVKVFDANYNYRFNFGSFSAEGGMGSFSGPTGIAVDHRGIVVADWGGGRVQVFDSQGSFSAYVTALSKPLYGPQGLTIGPDGQIYICDSGNHTVRIYRHPLAQL